jgi:hypothetical protein
MPFLSIYRVPYVVTANAGKVLFVSGVPATEDKDLVIEREDSSSITRGIWCLFQ